MPKRAVKSSTAPIPITTALNISALARDAGVSRKTIMRRLEKGWRPEAGRPPPHTPAQAQAHPPVRIAITEHGVAPIPRARTPHVAPLRPPLGVVRTVLLLLAVGFYVLIACAAVGGRN